jgi:L-2-hydroxyglutarate oxidase
MIDGEVECGPNAVLAFKREGYTKTSFNIKDTIDTFTWPGFHKVAKKNLRMGLNEYYRSFVKSAFVTALQKLIPEIQGDDLVAGGAGVRAQACDKTGGLLDDFFIVEDKRVVHVCNAPSPAATASLSIGDFISEKVISQLK